MKKVWAVSDGDYSDYHVKCICPTEEIAKEVSKKLYGAPEEFYFIESPDEVIKWTDYHVQLDIVTGNETRRWTNERTGFIGDPQDNAQEWVKLITAISPRGYDVALKIAQDKLTAIQARKAGF